MKKDTGERLSRMQQLLSPHEFRTMSQMDWRGLSRDGLQQSLYAAMDACEVRCVSIMATDASGHMRGTNAYALGKPSTREELQFHAWAVKYAQSKLQRERERKERKRRLAGAEMRPVERVQAVETLHPRIDPMIWATCGRKLPKEARP